MSWLLTMIYPRDQGRDVLNGSDGNDYLAGGQDDDTLNVEKEMMS